MPKPCTNCGWLLDDGSKFCSNCGERQPDDEDYSNETHVDAATEMEMIEVVGMTAEDLASRKRIVVDDDDELLRAKEPNKKAEKAKMKMPAFKMPAIKLPAFKNPFQKKKKEKKDENLADGIVTEVNDLELSEDGFPDFNKIEAEGIKADETTASPKKKGPKLPAIKLPISSLKGNTKAKRIILGVLLVIALLSVGIPTVISMQISADIAKKEKFKDTPGLITIAKENIKNDKHLKEALAAIAALNEKDGNEYIQDAIVNSTVSEKEKAIFVEVMLENSAKFADIEMLLNGYITTGNVDIGKILKNQDLIEVSDFYTKKMLKAIAADNYDIEKYYKAVEYIAPLQLRETRERITESILKNLKTAIVSWDTEKIKTIIKALKTYGDYELYKEQTDKMLVDITEFEKLAKDKAELIKEIADINLYNTSYNTYMLLDGYIVAKLDENTYEFAFLKHDYYFGKMPSDEHGILRTTTLKFETKGRFEAYVKKLMDTDIKLKQELGGTTQNWPIYTEVPASEVNLFEKQKEQVISNMSRLADLNVKLTEVYNKINLYNNIVYTLDKENVSPKIEIITEEDRLKGKQ